MILVITNADAGPCLSTSFLISKPPPTWNQKPFWFFSGEVSSHKLGKTIFFQSFQIIYWTFIWFLIASEILKENYIFENQNQKRYIWNSNCIGEGLMAGDGKESFRLGWKLSSMFYFNVTSCEHGFLVWACVTGMHWSACLADQHSYAGGVEPGGAPSVPCPD